MPSGIQISGTSKPALTTRLFPPRVPCPIHHTPSSFFSKEHWQFAPQHPSPHRDHSFPKPSHALNETSIIHKKELLSHTYKFSNCSENTIKLEMCLVSLISLQPAYTHTQATSLKITFYTCNILLPLAIIQNQKLTNWLFQTQWKYCSGFWALSPAFKPLHEEWTSRCCGVWPRHLLGKKHPSHVQSWNFSPRKNAVSWEKFYLLFTIQKKQFPFLVTHPGAAGAKRQQNKWFSACVYACRLTCRYTA